MKKINVTKSFLPPLDEFVAYLENIWESGNLTNQGPLLTQLEEQLSKKLDVNNIQIVSNGTIALQIALRALDITDGEIITTPFSYVATTSSILWERCTPVFVDIEPHTFCIDVKKIEAAITPQTKAIMAVHVFGYPCDVEAIEAIAARYKLKVVYDAAHAFGAKYKGRSLLDFGDISTCSFHATKPFHTSEGGAVVARNAEVSRRLNLIKHFGHVGDDHYTLGINAKASEFQAAMGLCNLKYIDDIITRRKAVHELYESLLDSRFYRPAIASYTQHNYAYFPVLFQDDKETLDVMRVLNAKKKLTSQNFYP